MELRVLQYFLAVAERGSVSAAAAACFVTQPAISRQLSRLEQELGVKLFQRTAAGLKLNPAGDRFYPIARDLTARADAGSRLMRGLESGRVDLVVACPATVMSILVAPFVAATGAPVADILGVPPLEVYAQLNKHVADLAIGTIRPPSSYSSLRLASPRLSVQYPAAARVFPSGQPVELIELVGRPLVLPSQGSAIRHAIDDAAVEQDIALDYAYEVSSSGVAQALAAAGSGLAIVAEPPQYGLVGNYLQVQGSEVTITDWVAWNPDHYAAPEIERLAAELVAFAQMHLGDPLNARDR